MNARIPPAALHQLDTLRVDGIAILAGEIAHRRMRPAVNAFTYLGFCLRLPLSRLAELPARGVAWNARGIVSFHDRDHGPCDGSPLEPWVRELLAREHVEADGEIVLHTFPRMLGYVFNPVSFWVAHGSDGVVRAVLVEVNNTFGERHDYLVAHPDGRAIVSGETLEASKVFHVSPFCDIKGRYAFRFGLDPARWLARIDYFDDDNATPLLETWISGRVEVLDLRAARRLVWRYRWFTLGVLVRIHWQAVRLWIKRVPAFTKPAPPDGALSRR